MSERTMTKISLTIITCIVGFVLLINALHEHDYQAPEQEWEPQVTVVEPVVVVIAPAVPAAAPATAAKPVKVKAPRLPHVPGVRLVHHIIRL